MQWSDANIGNGAAAAAWTDTVTVQNTTTARCWPASTSRTTRRPRATARSARDCSRKQATVALAQGNAGAGDLLITVTVNATDSLFEDNAAHNALANNAETATAVSGLAPYSDLVASGVTFSPASPIVGDPAKVTVGWTVTNSGTGPTRAGSWYDTIIVSSDEQSRRTGRCSRTSRTTAPWRWARAIAQSQNVPAAAGVLGQYHLFVAQRRRQRRLPERDEAGSIRPRPATFRRDADALRRPGRLRR